MNTIVRYLMMMSLLVGGSLGFPLAVPSERGLILDGFSVTDPQGDEVLLYQESYALVIGINDYTEWPTLPGVKKDVEEIKATLEAHGFTVVVEMDLNKVELDQVFSEFISLYGKDPENRLLFYFAGHGHTVNTSWGEELGYIVPVDAHFPNMT